MRYTRKGEEKKMTKKKTNDHKKAPDPLDVVKKAMEKKYGINTVMVAVEMPEDYKAISTGCVGLDALLGIGGIPLGTIAEIYGPPSSGKSTLAMNIVAQAQAAGYQCLLVDAERAFDRNLWAAMGVDLNKLYVVNQIIAEENLDIAENFVKSGAVDVVVIDSVSALAPKAEMEEQMDKQSIGLQARMMSKALMRFTPIAGAHEALIVFINQTRHKIHAFGDPETTSGGMSLPFYATTRIKVQGGEFNNSLIKDEAGEVIGHQTTFTVKKTRKAKPRTKTKIPLIYGVGYDLPWETLNIAVDYGIIDKKGAWFAYKGENIGQGEANTLVYLVENYDVYTEIRDKVLDTLGLTEKYERNSHKGS